MYDFQPITSTSNIDSINSIKMTSVAEPGYQALPPHVICYESLNLKNEGDSLKCVLNNRNTIKQEANETQHKKSTLKNDQYNFLRSCTKKLCQKYTQHYRYQPTN